MWNLIGSIEILQLVFLAFGKAVLQVPIDLGLTHILFIDTVTCLHSSIFLLTGLRIYTGEYKAQGPTLCPTEGRALRGPRALDSSV